MTCNNVPSPLAIGPFQGLIVLSSIVIHYKELECAYSPSRNITNVNTKLALNFTHFIFSFIDTSVYIDRGEVGLFYYFQRIYLYLHVLYITSPLIALKKINMNRSQDDSAFSTSFGNLIKSKYFTYFWRRTRLLIYFVYLLQEK